MSITPMPNLAALNQGGEFMDNIQKIHPEAWQALSDAKALIHYRYVQKLKWIRDDKQTTLLDLDRTTAQVEDSLEDYMVASMAEQHRLLCNGVVWAKHDLIRFPGNLTVLQKFALAEMALETFKHEAHLKACSKAIILLNKQGR